MNVFNRAAPRFLLVFLVFSATSAAAEISTSAVVGRIIINRLDIFDPRVPGESFWPFRVANKIHVTTKEHVILRELLLKPGERWDPLKSLESERNLRANGYFRYAEIKPVSAADGAVDLQVRTQDSWTTLIQVSAGTEGGDHFFIYGAQENNLLGYNKSLGFTHSQVGPTVRNDFRYSDPRLFSSFVKLSTLYATTRRGQSLAADLKRPFYSLKTPYAANATWSRIINEETLYRDAAELTRFIRDTRTIQASGGVRLEEDRWFVQRVQAGWYAEKNLFTPTAETAQPPPRARELSGPTAGYSWIQPRYVKETDINRMERVEDFNMGNELRLLGGFMGQALGSDRDRLIFNALDQQGLRFAPGRFVLAQIGAQGRSARGRLENALLFANLNLFWKTPGPLLPQTWIAHVEASAGRALDGENQIVLGGNNGLRGFKNNSFAGDKSVLLNLENRFFLPGEYFHLFRAGGALFFDSGTALPQGRGISLRRFNSDVGVGLRFSSTRSTGGNVFRMDVAYSLNRGPASGRFVFSAVGGQAFDIFNSSARRMKPGPQSELGNNVPTVFPSIR